MGDYQVLAKEVKSFDLNIEKILENWEVFHAIREIISNALDEQILSDTKSIDIYKEDNIWHIVDYGRGLSYFHLTQNENEEKKQNNNLIGRFGVGLKDALATLYRHGVNVKISSKYGVITLDESVKEGFDDIITLHAKIYPSYDSTMIGTNFSLEGCADEDIVKAKELFLIFTENNILETTEYGQIIERNNTIANIYINGVKVAEEPNFLFSYNITSLNKQIIKALNRERTNIGRSAYSDRVKNILLNCVKSEVMDALINDLQEFSSGNRHDELQWTEIQLYVSKKLADISQNITFVTPEEIKDAPSVIDDMSREGYSPIIISKKLLNKIENFNNIVDDDEVLTTTSQYLSNQREKFQPKFIGEEDLTEEELAVYERTNDILDLIGGCPKNVVEIKIAEDIYLDEFYYETVGLWQSFYQRIIIKRSQLFSLETYAGTLLHECAHAISGAKDVSRNFETQLTSLLGKVANEYFNNVILESDDTDQSCQEDFDLDMFSDMICEETDTDLENQLSDNNEEDMTDETIKEIVDELEHKEELSLFVNYKINKQDYLSILNKYDLDEEDIDKIFDELDNRGIIIVDEFNEKSRYYNEIINFVKEKIDLNGILYIDEFRDIIHCFDLNDEEREELYIYLDKMNILSDNNHFINEIQNGIIKINEYSWLLSEEKYEDIIARSDSICLEEIKDYIETNDIIIKKTSFFNLLKLIEVTTLIFGYRISEELIDDYIFEYNLEIEESNYLVNWISSQDIEIVDDDELFYNIYKIQDENKFKNNNGSFLYNMYWNICEYIPILQDYQIHSIYRKIEDGDLYFTDKFRIAGFKMVCLMAKKYSEDADFFSLIREANSVLENIIVKYDLKKDKSFYKYLEDEIENSIKLYIAK